MKIFREPSVLKKRTHIWILNLAIQYPIHISIGLLYDGQKVSPTSLNVQRVVTHSQGQRSIGVVIKKGKKIYQVRLRSGYKLKTVKNFKIGKTTHTL